MHCRDYISIMTIAPIVSKGSINLGGWAHFPCGGGGWGVVCFVLLLLFHTGKMSTEFTNNSKLNFTTYIKLAHLQGSFWVCSQPMRDDAMSSHWLNPCPE